MDPATIYALATIGSGIAGSLMGKKGGDLTPEQRALLDAQRQSVNIQNVLSRLNLARKQAQDPFWRAFQQMNYMRLPGFARQGIQAPDFSQPINPRINDFEIGGTAGSRSMGNAASRGKAILRSEY